MRVFSREPFQFLSAVTQLYGTGRRDMYVCELLTTPLQVMGAGGDTSSGVSVSGATLGDIQNIVHCLGDIY